MANTGFKGISARQTGNQLVFRAMLVDGAGAIVTSGTTNLYLYELQSDGTLSSYDFSSNTFKTTALTTDVLAMTHRQGNNNSTNTGIWTVALSTLTGFTINAMYMAVVTNSSASPVQQWTQFQYGGSEGDGVVTQGTTGLGYIQTAVAQLDYSSINGTTRGFIAQSWIFISGSTSPNISVTFTPAGITTNGRQTYSSIGGAGYYMSWSSVNSQWIISGAPGLTTGSYWISSGGVDGMLGPYAPAGGATGTPTVTAIGRPLTAYWSSLSIDSSGRVLLQPTQTGVTIPTVTTLTNDPSGVTTLLSRVTDGPVATVDDLSDIDVSSSVYVTVPAAIAAASQTASVISCIRGDTLARTLTLGTITGWVKLTFMVKALASDADSAAKIKIVKFASGGTNGLITLNGAAAADNTLGSLAVTNATTGTVDLTIAASVTSGFTVGQTWVWDCQVDYASTISTPVIGQFKTSVDITQATS